MKALTRRVVSEDSIHVLAYSPQGDLLAGGGGCSDQPGEVVLWHAADMTCYGRLALRHPVGDCVAFSNDGRLLAASPNITDRVELWQIDTLQQHAALQLLPPKRVSLAGLPQTETHVVHMAFAPDDRMLAAGCWDLHVKLWDVESGELRELGGRQPDNVDFVAFVQGGKQLVSGTHRLLCVWDVVSGECLQKLEIDDNWRHAFVPETESVVSVSRTGDLRVWNSADWSFTQHKLPRFRPPIWSLGYSRLSRLLAIGTEHGEVLFWKIQENVLAGRWRCGKAPVLSLAFSPVTPRLCIASESVVEYEYE